MDRRTFLVSTGAAAAAGTAATAHADERARSTFDVAPRPDARVVTAHLSPMFNSPYFRDIAERFGRHLIALSDGRVRLELMPTPITNAQGAGDAWFGFVDEIGTDDPALSYFAGLPVDLGLPADWHRAWLGAAGGQILWDDIAGNSGFKPFMIGHTAGTSGGWAAHDIATLADFHDAPVVATGLVAEVAHRIGARAQTMDATRSHAAFADGTVVYAEPQLPFAIAVAEGFGARGMWWVRDGFRPAGSVMAFTVANELWHSLSNADRAAISASAALIDSENAAAQQAHQAMVAPHLRTARAIQATSFPDLVVAGIRHQALDLVVNAAAQDVGTGRVHQAFMAFRAAATGLVAPDIGARSLA